ncbi:MAG TPA: tetratricopeptide repeat protein [Thermoanaerobaculia bacterium]|jgi:tetratricopeptide (TPR) repeat protein
MRREKSWLVLGILMLSLLGPAAAGAANDVLAPGVHLFESRRYEEARKFFEPYAARNPRDAEAAYYLGKTWFFLRQYERAAEWLEKAAALAPGRSEHHLWLARAYGRAAQQASLFKQPGLAKKAKAAWDKALAADPNNLDARSDLIQYYLQAPGFMGGSVEKAREQAAEIKKRDAVRGAVAYATIALDQKDAAGAERELKEAVQKAPADPRPRLTLGALYQSQEKWDAAFETFEGLLKAKPDDWDALYQIGRTGALSGRRLDRAEECLKRYLGHTPGPDSAPLANAHFRLGMVYEKKGNKAAARAEYQTALKLDPSLKEAKEALGKLG